MLLGSGMVAAAVSCSVSVAPPCQRGRGGDHFERGTGRVGLRDRPVDQRVVGVVPQPLPGLRLHVGIVRRQQVGVIGRRRHQRQNLAGGRFQGDDGALAGRPTAALLHRVPAGLLDARVDRGVDVAAARVATGEEVGQPAAEQPLVGSVEQQVLGALQAGAGIPQRVEAGDRCVHRGVGIHPQEAEAAVGGHRVGQQLAARR